MFGFLKRLLGQKKESNIFPAPSSCPDSFPWSCPYVILDTETTGLRPGTDQIIQLSAIRFGTDGHPEQAFSTYLNPGCPIPTRAMKINKITNRMVADAPTAEQVKARFIDFCSGLLIVGYNTAFDLKFLRYTFGDDFYNRDHLDAMVLARKYVNAPDYKLETVARFIDFCPQGIFHNALSDCEATAAVLAYISQKNVDIDSYVHRYSVEPLAEYPKFTSWSSKAEDLYRQGECARKEGRFSDALQLYDQIRDASVIVYPFLFESYAKIYRKQRDFQSEISILNEAISLLGAENCPSLVERREKAIRIRLADQNARQAEKEQARKRVERAKKKQARLDAIKNKPPREQNKPILKMDDDGNILEEFPSVAAAARAVGIDAKGIRNAVSGKQKHAGGFRWICKAVDP